MTRPGASVPIRSKDGSSAPERSGVFTTGLKSGLFRNDLSNVANPVVGGPSGEVMASGATYYSAIPDGQRLTAAAVSKDGRFALATSNRQLQSVFAWELTGIGSRAGGIEMAHPLEEVIASADAAIVCEDFDTLLQFYSEDAVLVIKPGVSVTGTAAIRKAFERIAEYFNHSVQVQQAGMVVLESGDTALVLARTVVSASNLPAVTRNATYVFRKDGGGRWRCAIDNSYGHDLLSVGTPESASD